MKRRFYSLAMAILPLLSFTSAFGSHECKVVRFSDVGWTDITATTALASLILENLGYESKIKQVSVPVTYMSLKNQDLDVFLGNWMPSMAADIRPYQADHSVETVGTLLKNARYTLAVPKYVSDAGIHSTQEMALHKDQFRGKIYGVEPGNDGNRLIQKMITDNAFGLQGWKLVESSEQAMLMEVHQAIHEKKWIAFLGWEPHPMNKKIQMTYLDGADQYFGPHQGSSTVYINTRKNYAQDCPNPTLLLKNLSLTTEIENELMGMILDQKMEPKDAAKKWLKLHWNLAKPWLKGVHSIDGQDGTLVLQAKLQT